MADHQCSMHTTAEIPISSVSVIYFGVRLDAYIITFRIENIPPEELLNYERI